MRVLALLAATLSLSVSLVAAASSDDQQCAYTCGQEAGGDHVAAAETCSQETDSTKQALCVCTNTELFNAIEACMKETCPSTATEYAKECSALSGSPRTSNVVPATFMGSGLLLAGLLL
ncbi:hypothetical protein EXIGLDRAFT_832560 [Exidia glandulosa HHB12029]|uniref:Extracellular membrane protein CFEM domain-containing protein n=1 Tax=Exidia glandulosa HHB12029 TaxID=1314781 RepID=A0A165LKB2_EXIGL|nr:hypothetical protein EXIGLDRAFT_832560 [Exidia glandulosa HHB12029]